MEDDQNNVTKRCRSIEDNKTASTSGNNGAVSMVQFLNFFVSISGTQVELNQVLSRNDDTAENVP